MKLNVGLIVAGILCSGTAKSQTWPDFHLTNGTHNTSYGVEDYSELYSKNLYIDPTAILQAGSTELDNIYDGNQVYLNGGTVYASVIDEADFTWNSGDLYLYGGTHSSLYGLDNGSGKSLCLDYGATLYRNSLGALPADNFISMFGTGLFVHDLEITGNQFYELSTIEVSGTLSGDLGASVMNGSNENRLILKGPSARWNTGGLSIGYGLFNSLEASNGAKINCAGIQLHRGGKRVSVSGEETELKSGSIIVGDNSEDFGINVDVSDGARVESSLAIGNGKSSGNLVTVTGDGSEWVAGQIFVGGHNSNNKLQIENGGSVICTKINVGVGPGHHTVNITGEGAQLHVDGTMDIFGYDNAVSVRSGGEVIIRDNLDIEGRNDETYFSISDGGRLRMMRNFDASIEGFRFLEGGTLSVEGQLSGLSTLEAGRRLETPNVLGDLTVHGTFAPGNSPADSIMNGALTIASDGTLEMELGGHVLGSEYDRLTVTNTAYLDGTLDIVLLDGFTLAYGDTFDLFNWEGGVSNQFTSISKTALTGTLEWNTDDLYTTGTLSVIPEPGVLSLMALFGGGFWIIRRYFPSV